MIAKLLEELMGSHDEFEQVTVFLDVATAAEARDLAAQIGVPTSRLLAELLPPAVREARSEWRSLTFRGATVDEKPQAGVMSFQLPERVK